MPKNHAPIERILFPADFSPFAERALRHAMTLTQKFKARLKVIHVIPQMMQAGDSLYAGVPWLLTPEARERVAEELRDFLKPLREARIDHEVEILEGEPWREILAAAEGMPSDLVVMGTHGRSGLERLFLGSVAEKLVRRLPCPVLTVGQEEGHTWQAPGLITRILCATDFSDTSSEALRLSLALARAHDSTVTLLHVLEDLPDIGDPRSHAVPAISTLRKDSEREAMKNLKRAVSEESAAGLRIETRVSTGRAYREILRLAAEERADLVVIGAQGHGPIEHLLSGSNAQHVIRRATCPVLIARPVKFRERPGGEASGGLTLASPESPKAG